MPTKPRPAATFYDAASLQAPANVAYLMKQVLSSIRRQADAQLAVHELTYAQWLPLYKIGKEPGHTVATLARDLDLDPPTITRAMDRLEAKSLVQRERSTEDRRVVKLALTPEGKKAARHVPDVLAQVLNGHLSDFTAQEWQTLLDLLGRMLANGEAHRAAGEAPH